jgi:hypothetical protein
MITLISSCDGSPEPDVEYSYFTYFGNNLYECQEIRECWHSSCSLGNCQSLDGTSIDQIYNAVFFRKER